MSGPAEVERRREKLRTQLENYVEQLLDRATTDDLVAALSAPTDVGAMAVLMDRVGLLDLVNNNGAEDEVDADGDTSSRPSDV